MMASRADRLRVYKSPDLSESMLGRFVFGTGWQPHLPGHRDTALNAHVQQNKWACCTYSVVRDARQSDHWGPCPQNSFPAAFIRSNASRTWSIGRMPGLALMTSLHAGMLIQPTTFHMHHKATYACWLQTCLRAHTHTHTHTFRATPIWRKHSTSRSASCRSSPRGPGTRANIRGGPTDACGCCGAAAGIGSGSAAGADAGAAAAAATNAGTSGT